MDAVVNQAGKFSAAGQAPLRQAAQLPLIDRVDIALGVATRAVTVTVIEVTGKSAIVVGVTAKPGIRIMAILQSRLAVDRGSVPNRKNVDISSRCTARPAVPA